MRPLRVVLVLAVCLGAAAMLAAAVRASSAHRDPCHLRHACPSDHHTYAYGPQSLVCTSYADERLPSDTQTVVVSGRTYWCHTSAASAAGQSSSSGGGSGGVSGGTACGVERWSVKTLSDPGARAVDFSPRATTIAALRRLRAPAELGALRIGPVEKTTYRVRARLVAFKVEEDSDIHLVIADPRTGATMIVEFPAAACTGKASAAAKTKMRAARTAILRCGAVSREEFRPLTGLATITGVGFFDFIHGQRGVAPNGIELHPVLAFTAPGCHVG